MNVAVCIASYRYAKPRFVASLAGLITWSMAQRVAYNGQECTPGLQTLVAEGMQLDIARERLAEQALATGPNYLLFLDDDMTFPRDALLRLAAHDRPLVGCNYPRRMNGAAISAASNGTFGAYQPIEPKAEGVEAVDVIGFGFALLQAGVLRSMPQPWFMGGTDEADANFCHRLKARGHQPHVDHSLSMEVGHIAEMILTFPR